MNRKLLWVTVISVVFWAMIRPGHACPSACVCKWKGGKQTVECLEKALITVPENIDGETQVLDVSGNNLQIIPRELFYKMNLTNLQRIHLRNCRIGQIGTRAFRGLTNLVELDLSYNLLTTVPSASFEDAPFLRYLSLANNPIQKIEANAFKMAIGLIKIDLSHCEIQTISAHAFDRLESLEWLKLNGNKLTELHPKTVDAMGKLHGLEFHDNPWSCDCTLRALKEWLSQSRVAYPVPPRCASPDRLAGRLFAEIGVDDFACKPQILLSSRYVEVATGENATVVCRVGAVPSADVHWYWNGRLLLNNSALSAFQKVLIREEGTFEKNSSLTLTNVMNNDSGEFHCVAENRAGTAEANFTVSVSRRRPKALSLGKWQVTGLAVALAVLVLAILTIGFILAWRMQRLSFAKTKPSASLDVVPPVKKTDAESKSTNVESNGPQKEPGTQRLPAPDRDTFVTHARNLHLNGTDTVDAELPRNSDVQVFSLFPQSRSSHSRTEDNSYLSSPVNASPSLNGWKNNGFSCDSELYGSDKTPIINEDECTLGRSALRSDYPPDYGLPMPGEFPPPGPPLYRMGIPLANHLPPEEESIRVRQRRAPLLPPASSVDPYFRVSLDDSYGYQEGCGTDV